MVVDDLFFNGDGDFPLHLAAHFRGHILGGVKVDGLVDARHDAVLHEQLDDFPRGLLHPGGQLAHGDLVGDLHGDGRFPGNLHLKAAQLLLLFVALLAAPELVVLFVLLLALFAADALLAALEILHPLGDQIVYIRKPVGVHLDGGGIHHPALPLPFRLLGLGGLDTLGVLSGRGCRLGRLLLGGRGRILLALLGLLLGTAGVIFPRLGLLNRVLGRLGHLFRNRFRLGGCLHGEDLLQGGNLVLLGEIVEHSVELHVRQHLGVGLGLFGELRHHLGNVLGGHAKVRRDFFQTILHNTHIKNAPPLTNNTLDDLKTADGKSGI